MSGGPAGPSGPPVTSTTPRGAAAPPSSPDPRLALARLVGAVALLIALGYLAGVGETVLLVLVLVACIVAHEAGHFAAAKAAGIKVTEFFVGFGPRLWSVRRGETEYGVKALPVGGYCRIVGMSNLEEVDPDDEPRTYRQAPLWRRLTVALAGSAMHLLIAVCVLFAMFFWTGDAGNYLNSARDLPASNPIVEIDGLAGGPSPAQAAGFHLGDRIVAVDGHRFADWDALSRYIRARAGARLDVTVARGGRDVHLFPTPVNRNAVTVTAPGQQPAPAPHPGQAPVGFIGIGVDPVVHSSLGEALSRAGGAWVHVSALTVHAFAHLATLHGVSSYVDMLSSRRAADSPGNEVRFASPVKVVSLLHQAGRDGLPTVLWLVAVLNLSIGIFNLIPLLPLDGGHVAIALYEGARSRPRRRYHADVAKLLPVFYLGLALIVLLGASALFLDLRDLVA